MANTDRRARASGFHPTGTATVARRASASPHRGQPHSQSAGVPCACCCAKKRRHFLAWRLSDITGVVRMGRVRLPDGPAGQIGGCVVRQRIAPAWCPARRANPRYLTRISGCCRRTGGFGCRRDGRSRGAHGRALAVARGCASQWRTPARRAKLLRTEGKLDFGCARLMTGRGRRTPRPYRQTLGGRLLQVLEFRLRLIVGAPRARATCEFLKSPRCR